MAKLTKQCLVEDRLRLKLSTCVAGGAQRRRRRRGQWSLGKLWRSSGEDDGRCKEAPRVDNRRNEGRGARIRRNGENGDVLCSLWNWREWEMRRGFQGGAACLHAWVEVRPWSSGEMARVCPRGDDVLPELQRIPTAHRALVGEVYSGWNSEQQCSLAG